MRRSVICKVAIVYDEGEVLRHSYDLVAERVLDLAATGQMQRA